MRKVIYHCLIEEANPVMHINLLINLYKFYNRTLFAHHFAVTFVDMWWISVPLGKGCGYLEGLR